MQIEIPKKKEQKARKYLKTGKWLKVGNLLEVKEIEYKNTLQPKCVKFITRKVKNSEKNK